MNKGKNHWKSSTYNCTIKSFGIHFLWIFHGKVSVQAPSRVIQLDFQIFIAKYTLTKKWRYLSKLIALQLHQRAKRGMPLILTYFSPKIWWDISGLNEDSSFSTSLTVRTAITINKAMKHPNRNENNEENIPNLMFKASFESMMKDCKALFFNKGPVTGRIPAHKH